MTFHSPGVAPLVEDRFLDRFLAAASRSPSAAAIQHTYRGCPVVYRWRDVVAEADRLMVGFSSYGLGEGKALVVEGEITPRLLIAAAAARAAGARVISVAPQLDAAARARVLHGAQAALVLVQSREAAEAWSEAGQGVAILLDHVTARGDGAAAGVETLDALRAAAQPNGWIARLPTEGGAPCCAPSIWIEESTAWCIGVDVILERWIGEAAALALPELLAAADRDRCRGNPTAWIVSAGRLEVVAGAFRGRLPDPLTLTGKVVARALAAPSSIWARPIVGLIRRRLGLGALDAIELHDDAGMPSTTGAREWLAVLSIFTADRPCRIPASSGEATVEGATS